MLVVLAVGITFFARSSSSLIGRVDMAWVTINVMRREDGEGLGFDYFSRVHSSPRTSNEYDNECPVFRALLMSEKGGKQGTKKFGR